MGLILNRPKTEHIMSDLQLFIYDKRHQIGNMRSVGGKFGNKKSLWLQLIAGTLAL